MALDDILKQVPVDDIAAKLGVSPEEARKAVQQGGAVLLDGLAKNAQTSEGSTAIENALKRHEGKPTVAKVDDVDQSDGGKIVKHVLGSDADKVATKLNESEKTPGIDFGKLLPILAPIVMGLIANATKDKSGGTATASGESGGGLGDIIGGLLGGDSGGGIGDLLGGLFGKK
ncbi:DUF937 domain-containing protein [Microbacterium sp.]|uniref:DUF937 domain-containing protein n=1 Tax=Microbacterium sp. TaxID=51671 RepID=UPI003F96C749